MNYFNAWLNCLYRTIPGILAVTMVRMNYLYYNKPIEFYDSHAWIQYFVIVITMVCIGNYLKVRYDWKF